MQQVILIQKSIPHYRQPVFEQMRSRLKEENIDLKVLYGQPGKKDAQRRDTAELEWGIQIQNQVFHIGESEIYWQPVFSHLKNADLIIVEQASKLLANYPIWLLRNLGYFKLAFWGHGKNLKSSSVNYFAEFLKRQISKRIDWWFAYTHNTAEIVSHIGFPPEKITILQNSIDTKILTESLYSLTPEELQAIRQSENIYSQNVGLFIGGMYPEKRLEFLLETIEYVHNQLSDFEMLFIGNGIESKNIITFCRTRPWSHFIGNKFGLTKVPYFKLSKVLLLPAAVGLTILDSFALETPLITIANMDHGPEIEYLQNNMNGILLQSPQTPESYGNRIVRFLTDTSEQELLRQGCIVAREKYNLENMVDNFVQGILLALHI